MSTNTDIIRTGYDAFGRGDIPAVLALFDPEIEWYSPEELPGGGTYNGTSAVGEFFSSLPGNYQELRVEPDRYLDAGDRVIVEGRHRGRINDVSFEVGFAHVWTLADGRVVQLREYMDSGKLLPLFASATADA